MSVWNEYKWLKCFQHEHRIHQGMLLHVWMYMWATQIKCCNAPRGGPTVQSQHLPPGGQPLQKHCFRYNIYAHANAESHVDTQLQSISFWIDILLDARLNVADYPPTPPTPSPKDAISSQTHQFLSNNSRQQPHRGYQPDTPGSSPALSVPLSSLQGERGDKVLYSDSDVQNVRNV